ncbi:uncharacterized protein LOC143460865 [Clavelina lepadiformis]|uniref:uncharacterized protein LOC143460865 n=1 Tax=Clavelina lepadiformis TaxID=159417 RepID=UPI0040415FFC
MTRKRRQPKATQHEPSDIDTIKLEAEQIVKNFNIEAEFHISSLEDAIVSIVESLKQEMHNVSKSMPKEIAEMTVQEYIDLYMKQAQPQDSGMEVDESSATECALSDISNQQATSGAMPQPSGAIMDDEISRKHKTKKQGKKTTKKKPPSTRTSRRKASSSLKTPAVSNTPANFKSFEGTPMLTRSRDLRSLQLSDKPRRMKVNDTIAAFQFQMFSERGSPLQVDRNISSQMNRKIHESLRLLMEESAESG